MSPVRNRVEVLHGVNMDMLGRRDATHYGTVTLAELERRITQYGLELELEVHCFQTNSEADFVKRLHALPGRVDALCMGDPRRPRDCGAAGRRGAPFGD